MSEAAAPGKVHARWQVIGLLVLVALNLLGGMYLIFSTLAAERTQRRIAAHINEVLEVLREIDRDAVNGETGQRGYYITLDQRYLAPFLAARGRHEQALARLKALTADDANPVHRAVVADIVSRSQAKFAEMNQSVALIQARRIHDALIQILSNQGQEAMDELRTSVTELEAIERAKLDAANARADQSEARLGPMLGVLLAVILISLWLGLRLVIRNADAEARAAQADALAQARDRADLLARELNHRVRNLFAVVLAIVQMSGRDTPESRPTLERVAERIRALLKAHELTQDGGREETASLGDLAETVLAPYRSEHAPCVLDGPFVRLPARQMIPIGLVLHELVTNAVKYGAWSQSGGGLSIRWHLAEGPEEARLLTLQWRESCPAGINPPAERPGFGSLLLQSSVRQLGGSWERRFHADGMELSLIFAVTA